jgi:hypothetical protein
MSDGGLQRKQITVDAESANYANGNVGKIGMLAKVLARVHV